MPNYFFPAQAEKIEGLHTPYEWVRDMLDEWEASGRPHLCFPYARNPERKKHYPRHFVNHTGMNDQFWLYMYYRARSGANPNFRLDKQIYFRIHGVGWCNQNYQPSDNNVHFVAGYPNMEVIVRFICDRFEEIRLDGAPMHKENFIHAEHGTVGAITATMRSQGITPVASVVCPEQIEDSRQIRSSIFAE